MDEAERERTGWPTTKAERQFRHIAVNNFTDWPCWRRDAHHGHDLTLTADEHPITDRLWCPGVPAHPATMIGRR